MNRLRHRLARLADRALLALVARRLNAGGVNSPFADSIWAAFETAGREEQRALSQERAGLCVDIAHREALTEFDKLQAQRAPLQ